MASYILTGAKTGLLLVPPALHYAPLTGKSNLMDNESLCDTKGHYQAFQMNLSYAKDYPSIKAIIDSITSKTEFIARHPPDLEDLKKQELHVSIKEPSLLR